jgi:NADPH:quinone reductase-like Zn-dependent oxidoreductase
MTATLLTGHGGSECLTYRSDVPTATPGADEGLVRVGAAGVNNTDINMRAAGQARSVALIDLAVFF